MEKYWVYDNEPTDKYEINIRNFLSKAFKHKELADKSARTLGLFQFLKTNEWNNSDEIYNSIFLDKEKKEHYFSKKNSKKIYEFLNSKQSGGNISDDSTPYDKLIWRWVSFVYWVSPNQIQEVVNFVEPFAFPLHTIEEDIPAIGEIIGLSIDLAAEINKNIAKYLQQIPGEMFGPPGAIIGYIFSTIFICFNMAIFVARKDLGEAFTQSFALIPIFGMAIQNATESGNKMLEKFSSKREKFINQISEFIPGLSDFLNMVLIDPNYSGDSKADGEYWKSKINEQSQSIKSSVEQLRNNLNTKETRDAFIESAKTNALQLKNTLSNKESRDALINSAKSKFFNGGKRFSNIESKRSKWKTQRKLKV